MRYLLLTVVLLTICGSGFAEGWKPFAGLSGLGAIPTHAGVDAKSIYFDPQEPSFGTNYEVGLNRNAHELYVGYQLHHSRPEYSYYSWKSGMYDTTEVYTSYSNRETKREFRVLFGWRYHPEGSESRPKLTPIIGGALAVGRISRRNLERWEESMEIDTIYNGYPAHGRVVLSSREYPMEISTPVNVAVLLEFGTMYRLVGRLSGSALAQFQMNYTEFEDEFTSHEVFMPAWVIGLRYSFRS